MVICKQAGYEGWGPPACVAEGGAAPLPGAETEDALLAIWE